MTRNMTASLVPVRLIAFSGSKLMTKTPGEDWRELTAEVASSLLGESMPTHYSPDGENWPESLRR